MEIPGVIVVVDVGAGDASAQTADGVRALAVYMPKNIPFSAFPVHNIMTIDELERRTGLDFFPDMPEGRIRIPG